MKNAVEKILFSILAFALCAILSALLLCGNLKPAYAVVDEHTVYRDDGTYNGTGTQTSGTYDIVCDDYKVLDEAYYGRPPSFGNGDPSLSNACSPLAGMNIVAFYDRWYENLIPDYTPGVMFSTGYQYHIDKGLAVTENVIKTLYGLMKTGEYGGTTSANFKSGLNTYVKNAGYKLSSTSFYGNTKTVNLNALKTAIQQDKVGLLMCSRFNFVINVNFYEELSYATVVKTNFDAGHMMMVTGYKILEFTLNGNAVCTETFLHVSSSFGSGERGYVQLNDSYLVIDEALIYTIS